MTLAGCVVAAATAASIALAAPPTGYACGDGKPNVAAQKCDCPAGKIPARNAKDQAICVDAPKPPPPPSPPPSSPPAKPADLYQDCTASPAPAPCPAAKPGVLVVVRATRLAITEQVQFELNSAAIAAGIPILDTVVQVLKDRPEITLEIGGHTDSKGDPETNKKLSQQRADTVRSYLIAKGISGERLTAVGYGMERPIVPNVTEANRAKNRRIEFARTDSPKTP